MLYNRPFARMLADLDDCPVIVEIGCAHHMPDDGGAWSYGSSSLAFAEHAAAHGGMVYSIDIEAKHLEICRRLLGEYECAWVPLLGDGEEMLRRLALPRIDLLYVDGNEGGDMAARQLTIALPMLRNGPVGRVVFDDCPIYGAPELLTDSSYRDPAAHGLRYCWQESVCMCYEPIREDAR